jgi:phage tail sheath protein FI
MSTIRRQLRREPIFTEEKMSLSFTFPGVRVQELPSAVRTITGVATSITGFVGRAWSGPVNQATTIFSYADYARQFGGQWRESTMSYAVEQFFANGGSQAVIVRVTNGTGTAASAAEFSTGAWTFQAASPGSWGKNLAITIDLQVKDPSDHTLFNLTVEDVAATSSNPGEDDLGRGGSGAIETFLNVSADPASARYVKTVLAQQSALLRLKNAPGGTPAAPALAAPGSPPAPASPPLASLKLTVADAGTGSDGAVIGSADVVPSDPQSKAGIYAFDQIDVLNLLCIPPVTPTSDNDIGGVWTAASTYCADRRALLIVDAPSNWSVDAAVSGVSAFSAIDRNHAAIYFPRVLLSDPLQENRLQDFAPCGVVAGVYARTDGDRGVWKAPAGIDTNLRGVAGLMINGKADNLVDAQIGRLNPLGINSLRAMPVVGQVVWGARTLEGADVLASQWKYVPVRRLALYIEESLFRGTQWVVFEPNDETLWGQIRLNVGGFMQTLFQQGAFQGDTPTEAYFVKCSSETTTQTDIDNGIVNIVVGFAPLKPAEFVVIKIQQIANQA